MKSLSFPQLFATLVIAFSILFLLSLASAWTGPTATAPAGNVAAPINVGATDQVKDAGISVNSLAVFGSQYVQDELGIGVASPVVSIETPGTLKIGDGAEVCQAVTEGAIRYNSTSKILEYCNATEWCPTSGCTPSTPVTVYLTSGSTWTVPSTWNSSDNTIELIGGGGGGAPDGGAGGGGAYSKATNVTLTAGASVSYAVGAAGANGGTAGGDTYICNSTSNCASISGSAVKVGAKGGGAGSNLSGASGGATGSGVGSTKYSGGNGASGNGNSGGGGGGSAGPNGNGGNGAAPSSVGGGGGGANGGASGNSSSGGNGRGGSGGATSYCGNGSNGGGGAGAYSGNYPGSYCIAGYGGVDPVWGSTGPGGGGGGGGNIYNIFSGGTGAINPAGTGPAGSYGAGGGGGGWGMQTGGAGGVGTQGIIVITYTP